LLVTAGGNPDRLRSEAAFAALCAANPIPASSGKTTRHRLNPAGDRNANRALHMIAVVRMRWDPDTRANVQRRTRDGLSKREIIRCLKRYIARQAYHAIIADLAPSPSPRLSRHLDHLHEGLPVERREVDAAADALRELTYTEDGKAALSGTLRTVRRLGHNYVCTEHLLVRILVADGPADQTLTALGLTAGLAEQALIQEIQRIQANRTAG
jgi:hypothetical protein